MCGSGWCSQCSQNKSCSKLLWKLFTEFLLPYVCSIGSVRSTSTCLSWELLYFPLSRTLIAMSWPHMMYTGWSQKNSEPLGHFLHHGDVQRSKKHIHETGWSLYFCTRAEKGWARMGGISFGHIWVQVIHKQWWPLVSWLTVILTWKPIARGCYFYCSSKKIILKCS